MSTDPFRLLSDAVEANDFDAFCAIYNPLEKEKGIPFHRHKGLCYQTLRLDRIDFFNHIYSHFKKSTESAFEEMFEGILGSRDLDSYVSLGHLIDANGIPSKSAVQSKVGQAWEEQDLELVTFLINKCDLTELSAKLFSHAGKVLQPSWVGAHYEKTEIERMLQAYTGSPLEPSKLEPLLLALPELEVSYLELRNLLTEEDAISAFAGTDQTALKSLTKPGRNEYGH